MSTSVSYEKTAFVAMDIGKNVHWFGAFEGLELEPIVEAFKLRSNQEGLGQVEEQLDGLLKGGKYERVVLGHEPTGIYHENWARALLRRYEPYLATDSCPQLVYRFVNPKVVKKRREGLTNGRYRKSDQIDLWAIVHCLRDGAGYPALLSKGEELWLGQWTRRQRQLQKRQREGEMQVLAQLDQLWPGLLVDVRRFEAMHPELAAPVPLVGTKPLTRRSVQAILNHCPDPHQFLGLGVEGIQAFFRQHIGRCGEATARKAYQIVAEAVLPPPEVAALLAVQLRWEASDLAQLTAQKQALEAEAEARVPQTAAWVLTTIPGISPVLAARYLGYLKHPQRFGTPAEVWAYAGFDPVLEESGDSRRVGKISRQGHPGLRDTLYLMGFHTARHLPAVKTVYQRALARGKGKVGATLHAAHKTNRLCHRLLYEQLPFDPTHDAPLP